jgi:hypothetical protein
LVKSVTDVAADDASAVPVSGVVRSVGDAVAGAAEESVVDAPAEVVVGAGPVAAPPVVPPPLELAAPPIVPPPVLVAPPFVVMPNAGLIALLLVGVLAVEAPTPVVAVDVLPPNVALALVGFVLVEVPLEELLFWLPAGPAPVSGIPSVEAGGGMARPAVGVGGLLAFTTMLPNCSRVFNRPRVLIGSSKGWARLDGGEFNIPAGASKF